LQRPGLRPNRAAYRSYARGIRCYDEDAIRGARWAEFCHSRFEFSLGRKPRELARTKGTESQRGPWQRGATKRAGGLRRAWVTRHNLKPKPYSTRSQSATRTQAVESKTQIGCRVVLAAKSSSTQLRSRKPFYWPNVSVRNLGKSGRKRWRDSSGAPASSCFSCG